MRPDINDGEELRPHVQDWAQEHGYTMAEAWARIVRAGLSAEGMENHDSEHGD